MKKLIEMIFSYFRKNHKALSVKDMDKAIGKAVLDNDNQTRKR